MLGIIYRTWVLARQDEIQDDVEDLRVAKTPSFDAEDDAVIPVETSEFPVTPHASDRDNPDATEPRSWQAAASCPPNTQPQKKNPVPNVTPQEGGGQ